MIDAKNIDFAYSKTTSRDELVLSDVSLHVAKGEWTSILGPNGCGKTTLLKCILGLERPSAGSVKIIDTFVAKAGASQIAQIAAFVPQTTEVPFDFSVFEMVLMGRIARKKGIFGFETCDDREAAKKAIESCDLKKLSSRNFHELSGGEKQRVVIARALAQEPKVLLLDEPTAFLDIGHQQEILELLKSLNKERGLTILSVMHDINLALVWCDKIALMQNGKICAHGRPEETVTYASLKSVFGTEVYVGINDLDGRPYYLPLKPK